MSPNRGSGFEPGSVQHQLEVGAGDRTAARASGRGPSRSSRSTPRPSGTRDVITTRTREQSSTTVRTMWPTSSRTARPRRSTSNTGSSPKPRQAPGAGCFLSRYTPSWAAAWSSNSLPHCEAGARDTSHRSRPRAADRCAYLRHQARSCRCRRCRSPSRCVRRSSARPASPARCSRVRRTTSARTSRPASNAARCSVGSWCRIASSIRRSSGPGSIPRLVAQQLAHPLVLARARRPAGRTDRALSSAAPNVVRAAAPRRSRLREHLDRLGRTIALQHQVGPASPRDLAAAPRARPPVRATTPPRASSPQGRPRHRRTRLAQRRRARRSGRVVRSRAAPAHASLYSSRSLRAGRSSTYPPVTVPHALAPASGSTVRVPPGDDRRRCARSSAPSAERSARHMRSMTRSIGPACAGPRAAHRAAGNLGPQRDGPVVTDGPAPPKTSNRRSSDRV